MPTDLTADSVHSSELTKSAPARGAYNPAVSLLTGGGDRPYVHGLVNSLVSHCAQLDVIGSDELIFPEFENTPELNFLNLKGDQNPDASFTRKVIRICVYYAKLLRYAATATPKFFHILWNNKFEFFDRTLLMLYYRMLGKKVVRTVHNVNAGRRDGKDGFLNRLTLRIQYSLSDHLFVHTDRCKCELIEQFGVPSSRITKIPFGINNSVPQTQLTSSDAKRLLGIAETDKAILFFGNITPYKGIEFLVQAFRQLAARQDGYRLVIAGAPRRHLDYWSTLERELAAEVQSGRAILRAEYIPDEDTEIYFKAADVLVLPYKHVYQSGVLFLGFNFGLPVIASDVGSLKDEIIEDKTGYAFKPEDSTDLARTIERYFASDLHANLETRREEIKEFTGRQHSWALVSEITRNVYATLDAAR